MARNAKSMRVEPPAPRLYVRVLRDEAELAEAAARAAEGERRLRDRLDARAARDEWMRDNVTERLSWQQFAIGVRAAGDGGDRPKIVPRSDALAGVTAAPVRPAAAGAVSSPPSAA